MSHHVVIPKSHPLLYHPPETVGGHLGDGDGIVRAHHVPEVANQLPVLGVGAHLGLADDVLNRGLEVRVRAPAGGIYFFELHILAIHPLQVLGASWWHHGVFAVTVSN